MGSVEKKKNTSNKKREVTNNMSKDTILSVRISKQEKGKIRALAKAKGMTESAYVRFMLSQKPSDYPEIIQILKDLINEVNHIGVNVNQIVKGNNSGFYNQGDKDRLYSYMRRLNISVNDVVKKIYK